jgi:hypothetical protein
MSIPACLKLMRSCTLLTVMAGLATNAVAQAPPPTPNFTVNWHPTLTFNLWPGDFNEDGHTDLVAAMQGGGVPGAEQAGDLVLAIGRGDGTFMPPISLGLVAFPLTVSDINADGFVDVVLLRGAYLEVLPGNGDGTFDEPIAVAAYAPFYELRVWAHAADLDGDGHRDILVTVPHDMLKIYRGNGDFTFEGPVDLQTQGGGYQPMDATSGDFNADGRRDFAVVSPNGIDVFLNTGGAMFAGSFIAQYPLTDITTRDMNGDGRLDLIASLGNIDFSEIGQHPGAVVILLGNGNGTFQPPQRYATGVQNAMSVVVGDFNGDGRLDAATGNRSAEFDGDLTHFWDSISVLPGDGAGRLLPATTLTLGNLHPGFFRPDPLYPYVNFQHQLNTSDLDGNRRTDLISSPGATLLNRPAAPNRPPSAFAGPDRTEFNFDGISLELRGTGTDPDRHWLTYTWTDEAGQVIGRVPWIRVNQPRGTTRTYTLTVDDGHGGTSGDSVTVHVPREFSDGDPYVGVGSVAPVVLGVPVMVVWDVIDESGILQSYSLSYSIDEGRTFTPVPGCQNLGATVRQCPWQNPGAITDTALLRLIAPGGGRNWIAISGQFSITARPPGWTSADIGEVGAAGSTAFAGGTWTIEGSGADIWGRADEFRYLYRQVRDTFTVTTRVASIENLNRWVKAGVMIREDLSPGSRHASLFATPTTERGIAFQRRSTANGISTHTAGPIAAPPGWLRLGRVGDTISAYFRASPGAPWTLVGRQVLPGLPSNVYVGLAVSSHVDGALATAQFDNVEVQTELFDQSQDVGAVGVAGGMAFDGVVHEVRASGADIWGTADAFHAVRWSGHPGPLSEITARVRSIGNTYPWAKAGVMFREINVQQPQAPHVMVVVTPGRGVAMQYRPEYGATSVQVAVIPGIAPEWVRLRRSDNRYTGYASEDGITWRTIGTIAVESLSFVPVLAVTSHDNSAATTAVFEEATVRPFWSR